MIFIQAAWAFLSPMCLWSDQGVVQDSLVMCRVIQRHESSVEVLIVLCVMSRSCISALSWPLWPKADTRRWIPWLCWYPVGLGSWVRRRRSDGRISDVPLWYGACQFCLRWNRIWLPGMGLNLINLCGDDLAQWECDSNCRSSFVICEWSLICCTIHLLTRQFHSTRKRHNGQT